MMRHKIRGLVLIVFYIFFVLNTPFVSAAFTDVYDEEWYNDSVEYASNAGYVAGYEDGSFRPNQLVTRAEFAAVMNKVMKLNSPAWISYDDVPSSAWYATAVRNCVKAGIIAGYDSAHFGPNDPITRQQAAVIIAKANNLEFIGGRSRYADDEIIESYAVGYVKSMTAAGYMVGMGYNQFQPTGTMTRAQMVTILHAMELSKSAYQKLADGESLRILAIGDSIGEGVGATNAQGFVNLIKENLDSQYHVTCMLNNICVNGTASFYGYAKSKLLDDQIPYDLVIVCYGHNDNEIGFSKNYELLLRAIKMRYPHSSIICVAEHSQRDNNNNPSSKMGVLERLSNHYSADIADVAKSYNAHRGSSLLSWDGTHPNNAGHILYAETVMNVIRQNVSNRKRWSKLPEPIDSSVKQFDHITYFDKDRFQRINSNTYVMTILSEQSGNVSVDCSCTPGINSITVSMDASKLNWTGGKIYISTQKDVLLMGNGIAKEKIAISFGAASQADTFNGIIISYP